MPASHPSIGWDRRALYTAASPLIFDVALPVGLYYLLNGQGVSTTLALIVGGLIPGLRSALSLVRTRTADYLAVMMVALFAVSLVLLAFSGNPRFLLLKESFGTALVGMWCLAGAWTARPMTFYTARPMITKGNPQALKAWEHLANTSATFRTIQHRLALVWGAGLLLEAALRILIVEHYPVHTAAGLVNIPIIVIIVGLSMLSGPLGGLTLMRLVAAEMNAWSSDPISADGRVWGPSRCDAAGFEVGPLRPRCDQRLVFQRVDQRDHGRPVDAEAPGHLLL